ncbi:MAG: hypothetical protein A3G20_06995 [Acidobacteria bacterium RIFCSPLOWO2_12_FULL_59_11]|nr:MAG: hypothetical protein A3G20_06995 [Acidobacteria bacterium RIFCSPLOWO2_12_FULL_59_11]OFW21187.1 MAG: hypothetical protein A3H27_08960 [Acidobacteria bacterium RIFCSPLOWO2_02_FULL_59_13]
MHPYDFIFVGLSLDLVGAVVLAKGFMFKNPQAAHYESLTIVGSNPFLLKSSMLQRGEAFVGGALLVLGFLLQIWGNLHGGIAASEPGWVNSVGRMLLVAVGTVAVAIASVRVVTSNARANFHRIFFRDVSADKKLKPTPGDPTWYDRMSLLLDLRRHRGETDADLLTRIEARWVALAKQYGDK